MIATLLGVCGRNATEWREATAEIETSLNYDHVSVRVFKRNMSAVINVAFCRAVPKIGAATLRVPHEINCVAHDQKPPQLAAVRSAR
jgi:hypothetical protein